MSSKNPYQSIEERGYWRSAVCGQTVAEGFKEIWMPKFNIDRKTKFLTAGSCFAQHISKWLIKNGYTWVEAEVPPADLSMGEWQNSGYGVFSFRTGNIYTVALLRQWVCQAVYPQSFIDEVFEENGVFYDPFRPLIPKEGCDSKAAILKLRKDTLEAMIKSLSEADVFIFTLGLTETWINSNGWVYPVCPGTIRGDYDPAVHYMLNYSYNLIVEDLTWVFDEIKKINSNIKFLLTVSPVPLTATASIEHVLPATIYSKSVLRSVAGFLSQTREDVDYFPSYELIASPPVKGEFFEENMRSVRDVGVNFVMQHFERAISPQDVVKATHAKPSAVVATPSFDDLVCEEILLDTWHENRAEEISRLCLVGDSHMGMLSKSLVSMKIPHAGGMIMNGSAWTSTLFYPDSEEIIVPLEDAGSRKRWRSTLPFFKQNNIGEKIILTNVCMQTHRTVSMFIEWLSVKKITKFTENDFIEYFVEHNKKQIDFIEKMNNVPDVKVVIVTDPPTQKINDEIKASLFLWEIYDNISAGFFNGMGYDVFNSRKYFEEAGFKEEFYSDAFYGAERDWFHGSQAYYDALAGALISKYQIIAR